LRLDRAGTGGKGAASLMAFDRVRRLDGPPRRPQDIHERHFAVLAMPTSTTSRWSCTRTRALSPFLTRITPAFLDHPPHSVE